MQKIFELMFTMYNALDVNIMVTNSKKVEIYTIYPYAFGKCGSTRPVLLHSCSGDGQRTRQKGFFLSKYQNMNLCSLKTPAAHLPPFIILKKPFMGAESLTGIDGEILKIISRKLNFSIALNSHSYDVGGTVYDNGTSTGIYELVSFLKFHR